MFFSFYLNFIFVRYNFSWLLMFSTFTLFFSFEFLFFRPRVLVLLQTNHNWIEIFVLFVDKPVDTETRSECTSISRFFIFVCVFRILSFSIQYMPVKRLPNVMYVRVCVCDCSCSFVAVQTSSSEHASFLPHRMILFMVVVGFLCFFYGPNPDHITDTETIYSQCNGIEYRVVIVRHVLVVLYFYIVWRCETIAQNRFSQIERWNEKKVYENRNVFVYRYLYMKKHHFDAKWTETSAVVIQFVVQSI